jgi:hypothetical protein
MRREYSAFNEINVVILCAINVLFIFQYSFGQEYRYKDPSLPVEDRVADLMQRMTLQEKIGQMTMLSLSKLKADKEVQSIFSKIHMAQFSTLANNYKI